MSNRPTGTVTFLFTDIEGSTKRWEQFPQQMRAALARHDTLLRAAVETHGGYVFKTVGDAFCTAFLTVVDALSAALDAQRALAAVDWTSLFLREPELQHSTLKVRMALHTGTAEEWDDDYFGPPVNRVARLLSAGHGGQILLSLATTELVRDHLPPGIQLLDFGERRLKDLIRPERVFQVVAPDLPSEFLPIKTLDVRPNNLPVQATSLVGREKEIARVLKLLANEHIYLVTLTGPGGVGKSRLGLQVAADVIDEFEDGTVFVALAPIVEPKLVVSTIAQAVGVKETPGQPLIDTVKSYLQDKQLLLILDNFEHVVEAAPAVSELVSASPRLKVLVTSRERLHLRGEYEFPVPPLALPDREHRLPIRADLVPALSQYEAVRLFIERAVASKPDFALTIRNAPMLAEICVRLDGLPLAIELAAARIKVLPPPAMLSRLESRLKLLTGGARDLPARQQTLRNTIEWSYDLLSKEEKQLFSRLAVFQGGRSLGAIEAVYNADRADRTGGNLQVDALDLVTSLLDQSLMYQIEGVEGQPRYWMLETIHEYAREKLTERGEMAAMQREHAEYFMALAEEAEPHLTDAKQAEWLDRLEEEHDNLRAALLWARANIEASVADGIEVGDEQRKDRAYGDLEPTEVGLRITGALWRFWEVRSYFSEGWEQIAGMLSLSASSTGQALHFQSQSRHTFRAKALNGAGNLAYRQGKYATARSLHEESLTIRRALEDEGGITSSLNNLGNAVYSQGDYSTARSLYEESLTIRRALGDKRGIASTLNNLGIVAYSQGDYDAARSLHEESLAIRRELRDKGGIAQSVANLGNVTVCQGDYAIARSLYEESLGLYWELGNKGGIALCLAGLGAVAAGIGQRQTQVQAQRGVKLLGAAEALLEDIDAVLIADDRIPYDRGIAAARTQLSEQEFEQAWAWGRAMTMGQAKAYALGETQA